MRLSDVATLGDMAQSLSEGIFRGSIWPLALGYGNQFFDFYLIGTFFGFG
jgi:hypothetical protein